MQPKLFSWGFKSRFSTFSDIYIFVSILGVYGWIAILRQRCIDHIPMRKPTSYDRALVPGAPPSWFMNSSNYGYTIRCTMKHGKPSHQLTLPQSKGGRPASRLFEVCVEFRYMAHLAIYPAWIDCVLMFWFAPGQLSTDADWAGRDTANQHEKYLTPTRVIQQDETSRIRSHVFSAKMSVELILTTNRVTEPLICVGLLCFNAMLHIYMIKSYQWLVK